MVDFSNKYMSLLWRIMNQGEEVDVGQWQSQDVKDNPNMISRELRHITFRLDNLHIANLQKAINPNLPWAEDHFQERVSGSPHNPPPSESWWPYAVQGNEAHKQNQKFSHTYPERFWPKFANIGGTRPNGRQVFVPHNGIRYEYGDLMDVVDLLTTNVQTRQAYLPIWFPEDTGAVDGQRVPCTLGYHFLCREGWMDIVYYIRSCDLMRHFTDDVYMACRLLEWIVGKLRDRSVDVRASSLIMHISSLHIFRGDYPMINRMLRQEEEFYEYGTPV